MKMDGFLGSAWLLVAGVVGLVGVGLAVRLLVCGCQAATPAADEPAKQEAGGDKGPPLYRFEVLDAAGEKVSMGDYRGKVLLIVNTASKCGFTKQYGGLEKLYQEFKDAGFVVLGFPCNQFGGQEPGDNAAIQEFCQVNYGVTFPVFAKIEVNGDGADPLFKYLKEQAPGLAGSEGIKWNFTKFLVDANGKVLERFGSKTDPEKLRGPIAKLLGQ